MACVRATLRRSNQSTTGDNKHAMTAATASGQSTGLSKLITCPSPQIKVTTSPTMAAIASPVSAVQMKRACFVVGGGKLMQLKMQN